MKKLIVCMAVALLAAPCFAQSKAETKFYKIDVAVRELEGGKVIGTRNYSMMINNSGQAAASIRTGDKVPVSSGKDGSFTYVDVGVNIDCQYVDIAGNEIVLRVTADVSGIVGTGTPPAINQTRWNSPVLIPLRKPTVVLVSDGASSKRQMQLELTATPMQ
ncbi:MAG TPA: hypothetical protein VNH18_30565 [Bryobacteraceae bacterium]|nr:hypothetical protein [Bryobacteraceae bacterium]